MCARVHICYANFRCLYVFAGLVLFCIVLAVHSYVFMLTSPLTRSNVSPLTGSTPVQAALAAVCLLEDRDRAATEGLPGPPQADL